MKVFRAFTHHYPVTIRYPNPICVDQRAITLRLDLCEDNQQWYFRLGDAYEREWMKTINLAMGSAGSFIDVGSNIGVFALAVAQAYPDKRVIAIEPLLSNYTKLEENIRANGLSNIEPLRAAVAEQNDPIQFYVNPIHDGGGSIIRPKEYLTGDVRINAASYQARHPQFVPDMEVSGLPLDDIVDMPSVLKIDVEGAEVIVLKSGLKTLKSGLVDLLVVEVINESIGETVRLLDDAGFDCFLYGQASPITDDFQFRRRLGNVLCLRRQSSIDDSVIAATKAGTLNA